MSTVKIKLKLKPKVTTSPVAPPPSAPPQKRGIKLHNNGTWTDARKRSFIISALRSAHGKWGPKIKCKLKAREERGKYRCVECHQLAPATLPPPPGGKRRIHNALVDHIVPVVDPVEGFVDWNTYIERMFVEQDGYQLLCHNCHTKKTAEERTVATLARRVRKK